MGPMLNLKALLAFAAVVAVVTGKKGHSHGSGSGSGSHESHESKEHDDNVPHLSGHPIPDGFQKFKHENDNHPHHKPGENHPHSPDYAHGPPKDPKYPSDQFPEKPPHELEHYGEYYCPLNDDDCGWKPDRKNDFCWKMFPHSNTRYEHAVEDCMTRSIKGCPAKLLIVENVENVFYSMTFEDIEFCPPHLRIDGQPINQTDNPGWETLSGEPITFPGGVWTNNTVHPFEPNTIDGSLTVNFGSKSISGFLFQDNTEYGMICQSCVVKIPDCPSLCNRCDEATTTTEMSTTTEEPEQRCEDVQGFHLTSVLGGMNLLNDRISAGWTVYDEEQQVCHIETDLAGEHAFNQKLAEGDLQPPPSIAAYFVMPEPRYDFGFAAYTTIDDHFYHMVLEGALEMADAASLKVIAGGVVEHYGHMEVTDSVAIFIAHSGQYSGPEPSSRSGHGDKSSEEKEEKAKPNSAMHYEKMRMPRAGFGLAEIVSARALERSLSAPVLSEHFVAFGGYTSGEGPEKDSLTDTIEYRQYDFFEDYLNNQWYADNSMMSPARENVTGIDIQDKVMLGPDHGKGWIMAEAKLSAPSRTMVAKMPFEYRDFVAVALVDTSPVKFDVFYWDDEIFREIRKLEPDAIDKGVGTFDYEELQDLTFIPEGCHLASLIFVRTTKEGAGYLLAVDDCSRNAYTVSLEVNGVVTGDVSVPNGPAPGEWIIHPYSIPENITARHLVNENEYLDFQSPPALIGYWEDETVSVVKFFNAKNGLFEDYPQIDDHGLKFPIRLPLPPMKGAVFGQDIVGDNELAFNAFFVDDLASNYKEALPSLDDRSLDHATRGDLLREGIKRLAMLETNKKEEVMRRLRE